MSDDVATETPAETEAPEMPTPGDLDKPLGPQGEKALHAEKEKRRAESAKRREVEDELKALRAQIAAAPKPETDAPNIETIRAEALAEANAIAFERIKRSEVKAAAAGKFADPADALRFLDLSTVEVDKDGNVDAGDLSDLLDGVLATKPYLGLARNAATTGSPDSGVRKDRRPEQISLAQLKQMHSDDIEVARLAGRLNDVLGVK